MSANAQYRLEAAGSPTEHWEAGAKHGARDGVRSNSAVGMHHINVDDLEQDDQHIARSDSVVWHTYVVDALQENEHNACDGLAVVCCAGCLRIIPAPTGTPAAI